MAALNKKRSTLLSYRSAIYRWFFLVALFGIVPLCAEDEEIRVALTTKTQLSPLYISSFHGQDSSFEPSYLKKLQKVLEFDFKHSGYTNLIEPDPLLEKTLSHADPNVAFSPPRWNKAEALFVMKGEIKGTKLNLYAFNVRNESVQLFEGIQLTGNLNADRQQIHKLSDAILLCFFGVHGINDTTILYSRQELEAGSNMNRWRAEIWQCDWDGQDAQQITTENNYLITPTFIPNSPDHDGGHYLYVNYKNGQPKIYFASVKAKTGKPLLDLRGNQLLPAISQKRDKIAFISDASGRADLFVQKLDNNGVLVGKPQQIFSYPRSTQGSPTFSPDGCKIAFVSDKDGVPRIYIIPSDLENNKRATPVVITKRNRENTCPNWSPDGTKLAYSAKTNGIRQIWIYDLLAEEEQQLTTGLGNKENPCWAPDSLHLVFNSTDPDSSELYLVNLNQPDAVKITSGPGRKHYPTWGTK